MRFRVHTLQFFEDCVGSSQLVRRVYGRPTRGYMYVGFVGRRCVHAAQFLGIALCQMRGNYEYKMWILRGAKKSSKAKIMKITYFLLLVLIHPCPLQTPAMSVLFVWRPGVNTRLQPCPWYWPLIGLEWSRDLDTGHWLVWRPGVNTRPIMWRNTG